MQSFFWPLPFNNSSKENTNHLNSCGKKEPYIDGRRASLHTQNKANISPAKSQVNRAVPTKNCKAPLKLSPFFVFCLSSQKTTLWFSERLRKSGIWCLLHLIYRSCPPFSHWGIEYPVKQVLPPVCNLSGNPRLITFFSSNIWHRREPAVHWQALCTGCCFQRFQNPALSAFMGKLLHIFLPLSLTPCAEYLH